MKRENRKVGFCLKPMKERKKKKMKPMKEWLTLDSRKGAGQIAKRNFKEDDVHYVFH